jgi:hypothetical protein
MQYLPADFAACQFCCSAGGETGYKVMLEKLLPATARLLEDDKQEVRQSASMTLVDIAQLVKPDDLGQYILTMILVIGYFIKKIYSNKFYFSVLPTKMIRKK